DASGLSETPVGVVAQGESPRQRNKRHALVTCPISWSDTQARVGGIGETLVCRHCGARIFHQPGVLRREELSLRAPVVHETGFIGGLSVDHPVVRQIELLEPVSRQIAEFGKVRSCRLESRERLTVKSVRSVVVKTQLLLTRQVVVQTKRDLILPNFALGHRKERLCA